MLNKLDFVKKFELVVKQEIKNYQDSLDFVLSSIREIKDDIHVSKKEINNNHALCQGQKKELEIEINNLKNFCTKLMQDVDRFIYDQKTLNGKNLTQFTEIENIISDSHEQKSYISHEFNEIRKTIDSLKKDLEECRNISKNHFNYLVELVVSEVTRARDEIQNTPTEVSLVKKHLEEKINSHKVDVYGILRELNIYRKENMITQKKIEHLYILIDRMKKSEGSL